MEHLLLCVVLIRLLSGLELVLSPIFSGLSLYPETTNNGAIIFMCSLDQLLELVLRPIFFGLGLVA